MRQRRNFAIQPFFLARQSPSPGQAAPKARLIATDVAIAGGRSYEFTVVYSAAAGINLNSLDSQDLRVTGPGNFDQLATLVRARSSRGKAIATYRITPPDGFWNEPDSGTYTVVWNARQVRSRSGKPNIKANLGGFQVNIASTAPVARLSLPVADVTTGGGRTHEFAIVYSDNGEINVATIDNRDIQVTGPGGFSQLARFVSINPSSNGSPRTAIYQITAPGGTWDDGDNGQYTITLLPNQIADTVGNSNPGGILGRFQVRTDTSAPQVTLGAADFKAGGGDVYSFTVTYRDQTAVNLATLDSNDIVVTGPNGFSQLATFVGVTPTTPGTTHTATYQIFAPGGLWDEADNGRYTIALQPNQVGDAIGHLNPGGSLGSFQVDLTPRPLNGTNGSDTLVGGPENNILCGEKDDDVLRGNGGNDTLIGGTGFDRLDGGEGEDTVSYADATDPVVVDLTTGVASRMARLMPLGDSITFGVTDRINDPKRLVGGGYRTVLWQEIQKADLKVDFVGMRNNGPDTLGDKDHEGHPGWRIDEIIYGDENEETGNRREPIIKIDDFLKTKPDIVLLMAGTNDIFRDSADLMSNELSQLIDIITDFSPDIQLFVAPIPPVHPDLPVETRDRYNENMPALIASKRVAGRNVYFVDMELTLKDISPREIDSGVHPSDDGYKKIGRFWYDALAKQLGTDQGTYRVDRDTLTSIENVIGSVFDDTLIGSRGNNVLEGGGGRDRLTGGGGRDVFFYRDPNQGEDTITDFGDDDLLRISAARFGGGLVGGVALSLRASDRGVLVNSSQSISDDPTFLYSNGTIRFDRDGTGSGQAVVIANLTNRPSNLKVEQFQIVS